MADVIINEYWVEKLFRPVFRRKSLAGDNDFFDKKDFPVTQELEDNYEVILAELKPLMERVADFAPFQDISPDQVYISNDEKMEDVFPQSGDLSLQKKL